MEEFTHYTVMKNEAVEYFDFSKDGIIHKNIIEWLLEKDN